MEINDLTEIKKKAIIFYLIIYLIFNNLKFVEINAFLKRTINYEMIPLINKEKTFIQK